ncbi:hypothetical protein P4H71_28140 [Paenibacillus kribbensis]|uniref:hypothetical protein n=1 Tax=Paenibacillus kribbensis TaxID=172713 RepID=UPI002DB57240|nr:hypothetical protein [Paenibacillus kribbensis]MEC0238188.1 hypothetical protein [Paenibacillus kribbensis]
MTEEKKRELVSWRINKYSDSEKLNNWVNAQSNVQHSITSLVRHIIQQFGSRDVMDQEIQTYLFQKPIIEDIRSLLSEFKSELNLHSQSTPNVAPAADPVPPTTDIPEKNEGEETAVSPAPGQFDDIYSRIDKNKF